MRIRDVVARSSHFRAIADVPVIDIDASLQAAFRILQGTSASFVLLEDEDDRYRFISAEDLAGAAADASMEVKVMTLRCGIEAPVVAAMSMDQPEAAITRVFVGPHATIPALIFDGTTIVGVWTPREDLSERLFTPAPIYYCKRNNHPNRPPRPSHCRYRGCGSDFP